MVNNTAKTNTEVNEKPETKEKLVKIRLPLTKENKGDEFVSVNDRTWQIQRGVEVEVPECVAEVFLNQQLMYEKSLAYEEEITKPKNH